MSRVRMQLRIIRTIELAHCHEAGITRVEHEDLDPERLSVLLHFLQDLGQRFGLLRAGHQCIGPLACAKLHITLLVASLLTISTRAQNDLTPSVQFLLALSRL